MKKIAVIFITVIIITTYHNFIFASYNGENIKQELYDEVEQVFHERAKIWNSFLTGQYTSLTQLEKELKVIVADPLLKYDMEMFKQMLDAPISYEGISNLYIEDIYIVKDGFKKTILEAIILWDIEGYENNYSEYIKYKIEIKKDKKRWLLSNYEVIG